MTDRQSAPPSESGAQQSTEDATITLSPSKSAVNRLVLGFGIGKLEVTSLEDKSKQDEVIVFFDGF